MFDQFPKVRPALPKAIAEIYAALYKSNREGATTAASMSQRAESWMHRQIAKDVQQKNRPLSTLEIGAGTLNQIAYEPAGAAYDIVEPFKELYAGSRLLSRVRN